jgi:hypothetical protein
MYHRDVSLGPSSLKITMSALLNLPLAGLLLKPFSQLWNNIGESKKKKGVIRFKNSFTCYFLILCQLSFSNGWWRGYILCCAPDRSYLSAIIVKCENNTCLVYLFFYQRLFCFVLFLFYTNYKCKRFLSFSAVKRFVSDLQFLHFYTFDKNLRM